MHFNEVHSDFREAGLNDLEHFSFCCKFDGYVNDYALSTISIITDYECLQHDFDEHSGKVQATCNFSIYCRWTIQGPPRSSLNITIDLKLKQSTVNATVKVIFFFFSFDLIFKLKRIIFSHQFILALL